MYCLALQIYQCDFDQDKSFKVAGPLSNAVQDIKIDPING